MSKPESRQVRLSHRGRQFHFVSYEGQREDLKRNRPPIAPAWFLMNAGTRWHVMPFLADQDDGDRDDALTAWLESHVFATTD